MISDWGVSHGRYKDNLLCHIFTLLVILGVVISVELSSLHTLEGNDLGTEVCED